MCSMEIQELVLPHRFRRYRIYSGEYSRYFSNEMAFHLEDKGYSFKISYINSNDKDIIPVFILNSDNTICKDPFSIDVMEDYALITQKHVKRNIELM